MMRLGEASNIFLYLSMLNLSSLHVMDSSGVPHLEVSRAAGAVEGRHLLATESILSLRYHLAYYAHLE
jgi:hypothetical protein